MKYKTNSANMSAELVLKILSIKIRGYPDRKRFHAVLRFRNASDEQFFTEQLHRVLGCFHCFLSGGF